MIIMDIFSIYYCYNMCYMPVSQQLQWGVLDKRFRPTTIKWKIRKFHFIPVFVHFLFCVSWTRSLMHISVTHKYLYPHSVFEFQAVSHQIHKTNENYYHLHAGNTLFLRIKLDKKYAREWILGIRYLYIVYIHWIEWNFSLFAESC